MTMKGSRSVHSITGQRAAAYLIHDNRMLAERAFYCLQQLDSVGFRFFADFLWPDGALHFSDVGFAQEEHADPGLADAAADGVGQLFLEDCFLERKLCALRGSRLFPAGTAVPLCPRGYP